MAPHHVKKSYLVLASKWCNMRYKDDWEKSRARLCAFWEQEIIDRCCISVISPKRGREEEYWRLKGLPRLYGWGDGERIVQKSRSQFEVSRFGGESFPGIWLNLGPSGHAGYFKGAEPQRDEQTVWYNPTLDDEYTNLILDKESELYQLTLELANYYVADSGGDYFISMPDTSGNIDAMAHLRGSGNLLIDLALESEELEKALIEIERGWEAIIGEVYEIVRENNDGGSVIYWLKSWAPGLHSQLQADLSVMISKDHFKKFILPELVAQSNFLEFPIYHFDGAEQERHLDDLLAIENLKAIQWMSVSGQKPPSAYLDVLKRIQAGGKSLLISIYDNREVEPLLTNLSSKGLYLVLETENEDELEAVLKMANRLTHD